MSNRVAVTSRFEYLRGGERGNISGPVTLREVYNNSGGALARGDIVIWDHANSTPDSLRVTTTTTAFHNDVAGVVYSDSIASAGIGFIIEEGPFTFLKVNGTTDIAAGDMIGTFTTAKIAQKSTTGGRFARAMEGYTTNDASGVIDAFITNLNLSSFSTE